MEKNYISPSKSKTSSLSFWVWTSIFAAGSFSIWTLGSSTSFSAVPQWKWSGFEIVGQQKIKRSDVIRFLKIKIGAPFQEEPEKWGQWCQEIKTQFKPESVHCSAVRFSDKRAFMVVDIVEASEKERLEFRKPPTDDEDLVTPQILKTYDSLYERLFKLFDEGKPAQETVKNGVKDYSDSKMSELARALAETVPRYKDDLFDVIEEDQDPNKRAKAANLLNWAKVDAEDVLKASDYLDDPSPLVRNDLSRFILAFVDLLKKEKEQKHLVSNLCTQLTRPSHGDRNKAVYALLFLAQSSENSRSIIRNGCQPWIARIAKQSILSNVRGPAKDLLRLL